MPHRTNQRRGYLLQRNVANLAFLSLERSRNRLLGSPASAAWPHKFRDHVTDQKALQVIQYDVSNVVDELSIIRI